MREATFESWLEGYKRAWETRDPQAAADLFTEDALYHETPFGEPARGREGIREYWTENPQRSQEDVRFAYGVLAVEGERGIAHWTSNFTKLPSGDRVALDGIFVIKLDAAGRCTELREWWHEKKVP